MGRAPGSVYQGMTGLVVAMLFGLLGLVHPTHAAELSCAAGDVACLITAIHTANSNGETNSITMAAGLYTLTVVDNDTDGPTGLPSVTSALTLRGAGAQSTVLERADGAPLPPPACGGHGPANPGGAHPFQPETVTIHRAVFADPLARLSVAATSAAPPDAALVATVPGCLANEPMLHLGSRYVLLRHVGACGNLNGQVVTVTSTYGGSAGAPLR